MALIQVDIIQKYYDSLLVLQDLSFSIKEGDLVSIVSPFGCGKTTVLNLISGLIEDYTGTIRITSEPPSTVRKRRKIGYCFQRPNLLPWLDVLENVLLPQRIAGIKTDQEKALDLLKMVNLHKFASKRPSELSGGMQQLISIARSLVLDPDILLLDEPFSSIDEINKSKMHTKLLEIRKQTKKTILLVTHDIEEAVFLSDQVIILTPRPAKVKRILDINFPQRTEKIIFSNKFLQYAKTIKRELTNE